MFARPLSLTAALLLAGTALVVPARAASAASPTAQASSGTPASPRFSVRPVAAAPDGGGPVLVAHRGASGYAPENTLAGVDKARELGVRWVENDVQRTKDGVLVVLHDTTLARTTDVEQVFPDRAPWNVKDFTAREISRLDAGSWFGPQFKGAKVPTLDQFLKRMSRHRLSLLLELKAPELYPGIERETLNALRRAGWLDRGHVRDRLVVQSFGADAVRRVHQLRPDVKTGFLGTPAQAELPAYAAFADQINPTHSTVTPSYVDAVQALKGPHGKRLEVYTWTVNDAATARKVRDAGVDGVITNFPDVVKDAIG
ncbi:MULTISPECIES: glycerophosphodiester phosphodiesterase [Streptomyces]|uniref:Glycerophosphodiester phosphodiesterase n=1 Tax=Streptomyces koyangensis TaxID=188770 RepID=A0A385DIK7_9ACTN|nr:MULTISPECIES: glycerophosphodiester phosphodiesterase family protein [Streptomyces]AXQ57779.1 glycerophosphodiester phosphodiesterase [Streptomyces koyangensis]PKR45255.1 glycerophosphodiester phosphodiesterase [Streptomyces sp. EAG2]WTD02142.1 glycerophosphodiester phosphodiesterase family protein [Streptomyces albidoflavus]